MAHLLAQPVNTSSNPRSSAPIRIVFICVMSPFSYEFDQFPLTGHRMSPDIVCPLEAVVFFQMNAVHSGLPPEAQSLSSRTASARHRGKRSDVETEGQHAAADVDPAQFARQIDPAVVDVDRVVVGVPLDVERVEQASVVGVTEFVASEAVGPEVNVAVQRIAVLIESEVSGPYAARERVVEIVVAAAGRN